MVKWKEINCHLAELGEVERTIGYILGPQGEKAGLKFNVQKPRIMTSSPITSWQIDGETVETVADFIFWAQGSLQIVTAAMKLKDTYSLEEKLWPT